MAAGDDATLPPQASVAADDNSPQALTDAFVASRDSLVRVLARRLGCAEAAQDVAQEAMERTLRAWGTAGPIRHPKALLFRIALNLAVNHAIAERRRDQLHQQARSYLFAEMDRPSPEQAADDRQRLANLQARLDLLPPQTRRILVLNRFEGLSQAQIAERLGISKTAVEKHMRRALARLSVVRQG
jgi:RNA polymerase sigma-70 factor (ECF subfamily)